MASTVDLSIDESAIEAIDDAAGYCRTLWVTFIGYAATVFVLASGTTHDHLLRETPVKLPLFDVDSGIPLTLFYVVAPLLLVLFHLNLLLKLHDLRVRVRAVTAPLQTMTDAEAGRFRARLRRTFTSFDYALLESGLVERREGFLLRAIVSTTIFIMPVVLLLFVQLQFLPYHDGKIAWVHRALLATDLALIAIIHFWLGWDGDGRGWKTWIPKSLSAARRTISLGLSFALPVFISVFVLAFPGERQDVFWRAAWSLARPPIEEFEMPVAFSALAGADFAESFGIRRSLYLADRTLWAEPPSEDLLQALNDDTTIIAFGEDVEGATPQLLRTVQRIRNVALTLRGRNLAYANFENSSLVAADFSPDLNNEQMRAFQRATVNDPFTGEMTELQNTTDLTGASFSGADLRGARLPYARGTGVDFTGANLQRTVLAKGRFDGADFSFARMQLADLTAAQLQAATLSDALMTNVNLSFSRLQGANLRGAELQGLDLVGAQLQGANLDSALLQDADLFEAQLQAAILTDAQLQGANLSGAQLQGARLNRAKLTGANLQAAQLQGADLSLADLQAADLREASLQGADVAEADLRGADFSGARLKATGFDNAQITLANFSGANLTADYDAGQLRPYAQAIFDDELRGEYLGRLTETEKRIAANAPPLREALGDDVWDGGDASAGSGAKPSTQARPAYLAAWAGFVAKHGCNADASDDTEAAAGTAIAKRLTARAIGLSDEERSPELRAKGAILARALLDNSCAKAQLASDQIDKLEEAAGPRSPAGQP